MLTATAPCAAHSAVQILRGAYWVYLEDWFRAFGRDRVLLLRSENYQADPGATLRSVAQYLNISEPGDDALDSMLRAGPIKDWKGRNPAIHPHTRKRLQVGLPCNALHRHWPMCCCGACIATQRCLQRSNMRSAITWF